MTETINLQTLDDGVAVVTFNRPEAMNALTLSMMESFADAVNRLSSDDQLRAVIVTGAGKDAFCSGGDIVELSGHPTENAARSFTTLMGEALLLLERLPVPVIAAINGYALGGGSEISVACDLRIVDERVRIGFMQIRLALIPGWGAGQRLLRLVGYPTALHLLLSGRVLQAEELVALGLVEKVVPVGTALEHALAYAREFITPHPLQVVRSIKGLLRAGVERPYNDALQIERDLFPALWTADPHLKAVNVFLMKQKAKKENR